MRITLKLYASLGRYLPAGAVARRVLIEVPGCPTPEAIITRYHIPPELASLVLVNGTYLDPDKRGQVALHDGDVLAIWPPIAGG